MNFSLEIPLKCPLFVQKGDPKCIGVNNKVVMWMYYKMVHQTSNVSSF